MGFFAFFEIDDTKTKNPNSLEYYYFPTFWLKKIMFAQGFKRNKSERNFW